MFEFDLFVSDLGGIYVMTYFTQQSLQTYGKTEVVEVLYCGCDPFGGFAKQGQLNLLSHLERKLGKVPT